MRIIQIEVGHMQNFNYLVGCGATGRAALVDPAWEVERVLGQAADAGFEVTDILITHTHPDHIEGLQRAQRATGATVHVHRLEAARARTRLQAAAADEGARRDPEGEAGVAVRELEDGDNIAVGDLTLRALHTPGHTPGATCYLVPGGVITGDTLFIGRCGRVDFPGSDPVAMFSSLRRLAALPEETVVYPGHNYAQQTTSTIGREKTQNIHMSAPDLDEFLRRRLGGVS